MTDKIFDDIKENIIYDENQDDYNKILSRWAEHYHKIKQKGLIPLFITGSGVSMNTTPKIPDIYEIINLIEQIYDKDTKCHKPEVDELFKTLKELGRDKKDRGTVARLLTAFQETETLEKIWNEFNGELIKTIVNAGRTTFHKYLADIHRNYNAITLTLNFDGLLIKEFVMHGKNKNEKAFSLPTKEECEKFFLRQKDKKDIKVYLEIQIRGDILYVKCNSDSFCPHKGQQHSLWAFIASYPGKDNQENEFNIKADFFRTCPSCGAKGTSYLSFPGSYEKEINMKEMLKIVWKHLSFRVGSVTVVGLSGEWDPLIVAFLGDLLTERNIPLLVIDRYPTHSSISGNPKGKQKFIIEELINPQIHKAKTLAFDADRFIEDFSNALSKQSLPISSTPEYNLNKTDEYWQNIFDENFPEMTNEVNKISIFENDLISILEEDNLIKFSQLGLKSYWLRGDKQDLRIHNRYNHSLGVMKIATYIYDTMLKKMKISNPNERQLLRIAALLHDIGHLPFSHLIESVFNELNWKPADYKYRYSHEFQTEKRIDELFSDNKYKQPLNYLGYTSEDLKKLINGCFGVGYLDAIINSPIDSDKIDYVFRDTEFTGRKISLAPVQFLKDIVNGLSISPEKYLSFSGISAMTAAQMLGARMHLYNNLYQQPSILILEGIVKLIIKTYFVHYIDTDNKNIIEQLDFTSKDYPDLGEYKINFCINGLINIMNAFETNEPCEQEIVKKMFEDIKKREKHMNPSFIKALEDGFTLVYNTNNNDINNIENKIIHKRLKRSKDDVSEIIRDVSFRVPGAAIIEMATTPNCLSTAHSRKRKERSDGTSIFSECIIVPQGDYRLWNPKHNADTSIHDCTLNDDKDDTIFVYIYPLSGDPNNSSFKQANNLFDKLLEKKSPVVR